MTPESLARAHRARMEVRRLEAELAKSRECQFIEGNLLALHIELFEMDADAVPDARNISGEIDDPCWKRHLHYDPMSDTHQWHSSAARCGIWLILPASATGSEGKSAEFI